MSFLLEVLLDVIYVHLISLVKLKVLISLKRKEILWSNLNKSIGLQRLCIFHREFESIWWSEASSVVFEMNGFQNIGEVSNIIKSCYQNILLFACFRLGWEGHGANALVKLSLESTKKEFGNPERKTGKIQTQLPETDKTWCSIIVFKQQLYYFNILFPQAQ